MATVYFRDDTDPVESERVFIAENGWVAVTGEERDPIMFPADRVDRVEGTDGLYYDTAVLTEEVGSRNVDDDGHVLQEPELIQRMMTEVEIY
ncbi:hypothetical protein ACERIT_15855 [Halopenitus sp. H-Gu1]|uniref:hypothetical protein n=1 Tax=Halopenitus sp. H-Gu1 TaxID=3242697 RepID=UPI00359EDA8D